MTSPISELQKEPSCAYCIHMAVATSLVCIALRLLFPLVQPYMKLIPAAVVVFLVVSSTVAVVVFTTLQNGTLTGQSAARSPVAQSDSRSATDVAVPLLTPETNEGHFQPFNFGGNGAENASTGVGDAAPWRQKRR
ncbi:uncharacterized protein LOC142583376 [Dermacentor variabilis]|uniref:uncharacterized protein LOC142583376 n=1 Tax=Dermacentor variabilis TaxID=34621 RepID=UPI003F5B3F04